MGRLREAVAANLPVKGPRCTVAVIRDRMTAEDLADFDELIRDEAVPLTTLTEQVSLLVSEHLGRASLVRHRRQVLGHPGGCSCQH